MVRMELETRIAMLENRVAGLERNADLQKGAAVEVATMIDPPRSFYGSKPERDSNAELIK